MEKIEKQQLKKSVHDFWNEASCGENLYLSGSEKANYMAQSKSRYDLEGEMIFGLARFNESSGKKVLEIGVGLGADHQKFAEAGADLYGIDLTKRAVEHTKKRLYAFGLRSNLSVGDAENLDFPDEFFDLVYSWGVLHHTPDTPKAIAEVYRVLKTGGGQG
jgi:ubiquinone/menaquinone biosynthesis C-methylase UbiE